jgi:hypothetical protein
LERYETILRCCIAVVCDQYVVAGVGNGHLYCIPSETSPMSCRKVHDALPQRSHNFSSSKYCPAIGYTASRILRHEALARAERNRRFTCVFCRSVDVVWWVGDYRRPIRSRLSYRKRMIYMLVHRSGAPLAKPCICLIETLSKSQSTVQIRQTFDRVICCACHTDSARTSLPRC